MSTERLKRIKREKHWELYLKYVAWKFTKLAEGMFGKRNVDVKVIPKPEGIKEAKVQIILRFPKIHITNSKGLAHDIRDFYTRSYFIVTPKRLYIYGELEGHRETFTFKEFCSNYAHSHLSGIGNKFQTFCFGDFHTPMNTLQREMSDETDWEGIENYLLHIPAFLEYESIEGVPYRWLKNLGYPDKTRLEHEDREESFYRFRDFCYNGEGRLPLDYKYFGNTGIQICLKEGEELDEYIFKTATHVGRMTNEGKYVGQGGTANLVRKFLKETKEHQHKDLGFTFKGRKIKRIIERPTEEDIKQSTTIIATCAHPEIKRYIIERLNKHLIRYSYEYQEEIQEQGAGHSEVPSELSCQREAYTERFKDYIGKHQYKEFVLDILYREDADSDIIWSWETYGDFKDGQTARGKAFGRSNLDNFIDLAAANRLPSQERRNR